MSQPLPQVAPNACSVRSAALEESAYGSAADASSWVCLQQDGPWGRAAATQSHLDAELGERLDAAVSGAGGRFALIRTPGAHPDDPRQMRPRTVLVASVGQRGWLLHGELRSPADLEALDVGALARGEQAAVMASVPGLRPDPSPVLLVCTNGRRDVCCAVRGRPVALSVAAERPGQVWETSHTGGHRFAPTAVLLPSGATLGRLDADLALQVLDAAGSGRLPRAVHGPIHDRGASNLPAPERAAVSAVRNATACEGLLDLWAGAAEVAGPDTWRIDVQHRDGRRWPVIATRGVLGPDRAESCAKPAVPQVGWSVQVGAVQGGAA